MRKTLLSVLFIAVCVSIPVGLCNAYPKPAVVQDLDEWTLDVQFDQPKQIVVDLPNVGKQRYWYTILTVTNNTGSEVPFYPRFELMTDTFQVIPAGRKYRRGVFAQIKRLNQGKYPFLEAMDDIVDHKVLAGEDNTRDIAVIWPDFDPNAKNVKLFFGGFSNETAVVQHPTKLNEQGEPAKIHLQKTLELNYSIGGDPSLRSQAGLAFKNKQWVMR
ncbi:hypothetical protein STSP2_02523 [Anaerohalosphaera lusitana]|uniref:Uncharacterized protein n=1 Tax=Anaerohalosphaera lusitana TaxID=1936003 RepID=A0A1U9NNM8_9BACT|nr:hypothetical protein [Anaerohalosphaera lusitana]AQT69334.1 hypothetical protein STSP2_02523 [Anaerohalosphaera lusitana]